MEESAVGHFGSNLDKEEFEEMLEVNGTLIVLVVSFLAFMYLLDMVFVKPISRVIEARSAKIETDIAESKKYRLEAETELAQYQKHLAEIRDKAQTTINEAVTAAQKSRTTEMEKIQQDGRDRLTKAKLSLQGEKSQLIDQLVDEEVALVDTIITKLIGKSSAGQKLDKAQVKRTLEEAC